jgi:transposase-like protein
MMNTKNRTQKDSAEKTVFDIRRATRRGYSPQEKICIVLEGLRGEDSIAEWCWKEGINQNLYYRWLKEFLEAGKRRSAGDVVREVTMIIGGSGTTALPVTRIHANMAKTTANPTPPPNRIFLTLL